MNIIELRKIARTLIKAGADVNAEHKSPINGYTPLMLAAENDEKELFESMLIAGGDLRKTYKNTENGNDVSLFEIATYFKSQGVLRVLRDIAPNAGFC
ncbi:hypothetical protein KDN34_11090 [Shewanella yunxiaonensis]|uniref:Ankyrin n=1 Tax=Shewanella yunxiaonensis TaxID=2829809 RepID=A0ABX7YPV1_9GAMM|nr:hypothetical protein [Shewanella yunxiaonensis]QUN04794.1 hypothetical protein KDN34_11090 [Shewanella yunxiaonensis]